MSTSLQLTRKEKKALKTGRVSGIYDILFRLTEDCPAPRKANSSWSYIVTSEMSGLPAGCTEFSCRDRNLRNTAAFSSLYADQVVFSNPLSYAVQRYTHVDTASDQISINTSQAAVEDVCYAISSILRLKPLIESQVAAFVDFSPEYVCSDCFQEALAAGLKTDERFDLNVLTSYAAALNESTVTIESVDSEKVVLSINGPGGPSCEPIYFMYVANELAQPALENHQVGRVLSVGEVHGMGLFRHAAEVASSDFVARNVAKERYEIGTIFADSLELDVMGRLFGDSGLSKIVNLDLPFCATSVRHLT